MAKLDKFTWGDVKKFLEKATPKELEKPVMGFIEAEPWPASDIAKSGANDDTYPNQIYLKFE